MAVHNYVLSKYMSFTSKSDLQVDVTQLMDHGSYVIADPKSLIAFDMFSALESLIDPAYTDHTIRNLFLSDGRYRLQTFDGVTQDAKLSVCIFIDNKNCQYYYEVRGGLSVRQIYYVSRIDDLDVRYLVAEHIIAPEPGVGLIERCYRPYFQDLFKAERYQSLKMNNYTIQHGLSASGFRIFVVNVNEIENSRWYQDNIEIVRQIKEYDMDAEDYRYMPSVTDILSAIRAHAYDDMPAADQAKINREIYASIREYIPEDELPSMEEYVEQSEDKDMESVTDQAIILAISNAPDKKTFDSIYHALGYYDYRIGALTDVIYNEHPDEGFILASTSGELHWYPECYFIGMWEKAKANPYFGKFQLNENDTLLSFREFRPDLFVSDFPDQNIMDYWKKQYLSETAAVRARHDEMKFLKDEHGEDMVLGDWYYEGLQSKKTAPNIRFYRTYGSHTFTEDECRKLLSGEEITVQHFISKADLETTIQGELRDCSTPYDEDLMVTFIRTDINVSKSRLMIDAELGITETGLPPPSDKR